MAAFERNRAGRGARIVACAAALFLAGMSAAGAAPVDPAADHLFAAAFKDLTQYYLRPVSFESVAAAGLTALDAPDKHFLVEDVDHHFVLVDHGATIDRLDPPAAEDTAGWARLVATAIAEARARSPKLAAEPAEHVYARIFDTFLPTLDRFSRYADPEKARALRAAREGFGGIGVTLDYSEPAPRISSVVPNGPSFRAGLEVDDRIIAIDGVASLQLPRDELVSRLRGAVDSRVLLTIARAGLDRPLAATVTRGLIVEPTVATETSDGIATFHVSSFNVDTGDDLRRAIAAARRKLGDGFKGAILDLRGNPGGLLDQGAAVAGAFLDHGTIVSVRGRNPTSAQQFSATTGDALGGRPLVVLVNGGSASAAEIVAAALQDDGRAVLVGSSSFGKGTVQIVLRLDNGGELTLTWARLYAPSGYLLHHHGVVPRFCTSRTIDPVAPPQGDAERLQAVLEGGLRPATTLPRAALDEAAWAALRRSCPATTRTTGMDVTVARRLIEDHVLYAQALGTGPVTVAHAGKAATPTLQ